MKTYTYLILLFSILTYTSCSSTKNNGYDVLADMNSYSLNGIEEIVFNGSSDLQIVVNKKNSESNIQGKCSFKTEGKKLIVASNSEDIVLFMCGYKFPDIVFNGSSDAIINGRAERVTMYSKGSGDIDASKLKVERLNYFSKGSGDAIVYASVQANITLDGSGDIKVKGLPKLTNKMGKYAYNIK